MLSPSLTKNELDALIQVSLTVNAHLDLDTVLELVMSVTTDVMQVESSSLVLIDDDTHDLLFHVARGEKADVVKPVRMKYGEGIIGWVIEYGKPTIVNDVDSDPRFFQKIDLESGYNTKSALCVPLETNNNVWGAIEVLNKLGADEFDDHDLVLLEAIASHAAISIENARLHEQIISTERLVSIGQTIAGLAHCVKNILNGIQGGTYMVDLGFSNNDSLKLHKGWEIVKKNNTFLQELMLDMLSYSKKRDPEYDLVDVNEAIETICTSMSAKANEKDVDLSWSLSPSIERVMLDIKGIKRCLLNLVTNAIDACSVTDHGKVDVSTEDGNNGTFRITVSDNGCGISKEDRDKIFQMFFSTKGPKGTGLGLSVTSKIIAEHNGTIDLVSEEGKGSSFIIELPMRKN